MDEYAAILGGDRAEQFTHLLQDLTHHYQTKLQQLDTLQQRINQEKQQLLEKLDGLNHLQSQESLPQQTISVSQATIVPKPVAAIDHQDPFQAVVEVIPTSIQSVEAVTNQRDSALIDGDNTTDSSTDETAIVPPESVAATSNSKSNAASKGTGKAGKGGKPSKGTANTHQAKQPEGGDLTQLRRQEFRQTTMLEAVNRVLGRNPEEAMHIDEIIGELYDSLSKDQRQRVKNLVNNTLSRGKREQRWHGMSDRPGYYQVS